jgi:Tol biopolymer transport system component
MALSSGSQLGAYAILSALGAGGMGEVYRAKDTKLGRDVALKILPASFTNDPERVARFRREAQVLASLNHPHIGQIYGLEEANDTQFLVLELVDGESLDKRIARGPIPVDEALGIAKQIAEALEAAHEKGIIHRDLKPANIALTTDGSVKVLDFGLAKAVEATASTSNLSMSPTITTPAMMTGVGVILGTAAYMSPEQAKGRPADKRSDIWAFGCVLYEMLAGRPPFEVGDTVTDTIAGIIKTEPDWRDLSTLTSPRVITLLQRCLRKDPRERLPHIGVARLDIEDGRSETTGVISGASAGSIVRRRVVLPWAISVVAIALASVLAVVIVRQDPSSVGVVRFSLFAGDDMTFGSDVVGRGTNAPAPQFAPSPDGRTIAFVAFRAQQKAQLWVRRLDTLATRMLPGTDDASFPFWSPDGRFIAFFAQGKLKRIDVAGGAPLTICDAPAGEGGTWNHEDIIVFARDDAGGLFRVSAAGGVAIAVTTLDATHNEVSHRWPQFLPDGRHFLYLAMLGTQQQRPLNEPISLDNLRSTFVGSLDSTDRSLILRGALRTTYGSGYLLFLRDATLMAQRFDPKALRLSGDPVPVAEGIASNSGNGRTAVNLSNSGVLTYRTAVITGGRSVLAWFDRTGRRLGSLGALANYLEMQISPDAHSVAALIANRTVGAAVVSPGPQSADIWLLDLARNAIATRLTVPSEQLKAGIAWSPDGSRLVFGAIGQNLQGGGVYGISAAAPESAERFSTSERGQRPTSWSPDGRFVVFVQINQRFHRDVWLLPLFGDRKPTPMLQSTLNHEDAVFSPDGRWIAYASDRDGLFNAYVRAFPAGAREWRISQGIGEAAQWRADGRELFYWNPSARAVMAVPIRVTSTLEPGTPIKLFEGPPLRASGVGQFSVTADGQRFLMIEPEEGLGQAGASKSPIEVVLNWPSAVGQDR